MSHIDRIAALPGVRPGALVSSFRLTAVSQPQNRNVPTANAVAMLPSPCTPKGLSHAAWKARCAWLLSATLMMPPMENTTTATYSMMHSTHWKFVVHRIP